MRDFLVSVKKDSGANITRNATADLPELIVEQNGQRLIFKACQSKVHSRQAK